MHVDEFIDGLKTDAYASWVLNYFRLPAILKMKFEPFMEGRKLFCTFNGCRYRVTGASRLGDVRLAANFKEDTRYDKRVDVAECSEFSASP